MNFNNAPIKQKLTTVIMLTSTVVLLLTAAVFIVHEVVTFHQTRGQSAQTIARITAAQSSAAVDYENVPDCRKIISKLGGEARILLAALYGRKDQILARFPESADARSFPAKPEIGEYAVEDRAVSIVVPVQQDGRLVGALYLKWDLRPVYRRFQWDAGMLALLLIATLGVGFAVSNALQHRISGPILELAETVAKVSARHDYSLRATKRSNDELGFLTDAFNRMLAQIGEKNEALRKNEEQLRQALHAARVAAEEVKALNAELEDRVARRTAELAEANQELEAFAYTVSHDLRAPLRHIDSFAQLLQDELPDNPEVAQQYVDRIRARAQNMSRLVEDLLNLSRLGKAGLERRNLPLNAIVDEVVADARLELNGREVEWRVGELPAASVDPALFRQVFANLISNAVKYTRPRGRAVIEIGAEPADGLVGVFVRDNGVGFDMQHADSIFRVFRRLHRADEFEGNGIGLATVERIIRLHGGKIWFHAEPDKGATFHFTLPREK